LQLRRSQLFVPGNDEQKIRKALDVLACDSIIFDLEDAVPQEEKQRARKIINQILSDYEWEKRSRTREICVRINQHDSPFHREDVEAFKNSAFVSSIVIPKSETKSVKELHSLLPEKNLMPIIESARGSLDVEDIARVGGVAAISFGAADFANSLGGNIDTYMQNNYVKTRIAIVAKAYGVDPIDNVHFRLADLEAFRIVAKGSRDLGYVGKQVIHPSQVKIANQVFSPSSEEVDKAKKIVALYDKVKSEQGRGALRMNEQLIDAVHYRMAKQILQERGLNQLVSWESV
jgi:citrate lyase subunit beta/citryl-CoA lyase